MLQNYKNIITFAYTKYNNLSIMKKFFIMCAAVFLSSASMMAKNEITLKDVTGSTFKAEMVTGMDPIPGTDQYASISNDGKRIITYSFRTGKETGVLLDVKNTMGEKIDEVDGYILSPDGSRMLVQTHTKRIYRRSFTADYYIYTIKSHKLERLSDGGSQQCPVWSPDGLQVAFVRDNNIFLVKLLYDNAESQVTKDGKFGEVINGIPDWVNEEEFSTNCSLTFNADGSMICWIKYDERQVKQYSLQMFKGANPAINALATYPGFYSYKYPKAGEVNSVVTAWSYDIKSHVTRQLNVPLDKDGYMPRIHSTKNASSILVTTMNRHQDQMNIYTVNPRSCVARLLIQEKNDKYIKEEAMEGIIVGENSLLLPSDRDGFMHLYLYSLNGTLLRKVAPGNYDITEVYGYNEAAGDVYYQAASLNAHDRQVFVAHKNGKIERLTNQEGWNTATFSGDYKYFLNNWSDYDTPYVYTIRDNSGKVLSTPIDNKALKAKVAEYGFAKREAFSFTTVEGVKLDGWMVKPANFDANKKYPVIMFQYGGPGSQQVRNCWAAGSMGNGGAFDSYLAQRGFIVVCVDGRGTGGRGADFEKCIYLKLGQLEAKDQVETALWLGKQSYVDASNIGIWGWSFGGFNTLMSMSEGSGVFKAGVAVAPPTDFRFYDTVYTERYMRTPKENPSGYDDNAITRSANLHGALLLCHGVADDNVHPQNTFEYAEALVQADKDFKENYYTNRNHSIYGGNTRNHLLRQIASWFEQHLRR